MLALSSACVAVVWSLGFGLVPPVVQALEAVAPFQFQVGLEVKVRIAVLLVDATALLDNLGYLGPTYSCGLCI